MIIDGIFASEAIDKSGESLDVRGADITDFVTGKGVANWEHRSGQESTALDVVGKVIHARKLFTERDCENPRQLAYFRKIGLPCIYGMVRLFDESGHPGAQAVAAMIRDSKKNGESMVVGFSVEGSTLDRDKHNQAKLTATVCRAVAITVKPCNASCISDVVEDKAATTPAMEKAERPRLGAVVELEVEDMEAPEELTKALTAGGTGGAPGSQVGGAALAKEVKANHGTPCPSCGGSLGVPHEDGNRTCLDCYTEHDPKMIDLASRKHRVVGDTDKSEGLAKDMPEGAMAEVMHHDAPQPKIGKPDRQKPKAPPAKTAKPKALPAPKTGKKVAPAPAKKPLTQALEPVFDEENGILHTFQGPHPLYLPKHDGTEAQYEQLLADPRVDEFHGRAMAGWTRVHDLLKQHKLPAEVVMHGVLFSMLSPSMPVPMQERMYSHLIDYMKQSGHDPRTPGFGPAIQQHWLAQQGNEGGNKYPEHAREHFVDHAGIHTKEGVLHSIMMGMPNAGAGRVGKYHFMQDFATHLMEKHGRDARSATTEMLNHKVEFDKWKDRKANVGKDPREYGKEHEGGGPVFGLDVKTARYAMGMMGAGNVTVPDTHFIRHLFGLRHKIDKDKIEHIKDTLWNAARPHLMDGIDRWYVKNHPAVEHMVNHPKWGKHFSNREDAIFPAFWRHWMTILPHERLRGMVAGGKNELTTHAPFWQAIDPFTKLGKMEASGDLPLVTARIHQKYVEAFGEVPGSMLFHAFLLPRLIEAAQHRTAMADSSNMLAGTSPKLERLAVELQGHAGVNDTLYHEGPQVHQVHLPLDNGRVAAGRFMIHQGLVHHLEDYHGLLERMLPEGPMDDRSTAVLHGLQASPNVRMQLDHELPEDPDSEVQAPQPAPQADFAATPPAEPQLPAPVGGKETYHYQRVGMTKPALMEVSGDTIYLDGSPLTPGLIQLMMQNVELGAATLKPAPRGEGMVKSEGLRKDESDVMDPGTALTHIRAAVAAGHVHPDVERAMTRHLYEDKMTPGLGNKYAYSQFRAQRKPGVYVQMDGTDFKAINDLHGHDAGDAAIGAFGKAMRESMDEAVGRDKGKLFRDPDVQDLYRNGGDEFVAHVPSYEHAVRFMHSVRQKLDAHPPIGGTHKLSMSFGLGHTHEHADAALYEAKKQKLSATGQRRWNAGQTPHLAHSLVPGREGPIPLHTEHPPTPVPTPSVAPPKTA